MLYHVHPKQISGEITDLVWWTIRPLYHDVLIHIVTLIVMRLVQEGFCYHQLRMTSVTHTEQDQLVVVVMMATLYLLILLNVSMLIIVILGIQSW